MGENYDSKNIYVGFQSSARKKSNRIKFLHKIFSCPRNSGRESKERKILWVEV